jgi:hypothetical protein
VPTAVHWRQPPRPNLSIGAIGGVMRNIWKKFEDRRVRVRAGRRWNCHRHRSGFQHARSHVLRLSEQCGGRSLQRQHDGGTEVLWEGQGCHLEPGGANGRDGYARYARYARYDRCVRCDGCDGCDRFGRSIRCDGCDGCDRFGRSIRCVGCDRCHRFAWAHGTCRNERRRWSIVSRG